MIFVVHPMLGLPSYVGINLKMIKFDQIGSCPLVCFLRRKEVALVQWFTSFWSQDPFSLLEHVETTTKNFYGAGGIINR